MNVHYNVICDVIIRKTLSLIKFLRLQGDDMSAPYDKKNFI